MNMEFNKFFAAALTAGIIAYFAGFASNALVQPHHLAENSYPIETTETAPAVGKKAAPATAEPITDLMATADMARGKKLSKQCMSCHTFNKDGKNRIGPNLYNIVDGQKAVTSGFSYSKAMVAAGGTWDVETLNAFLWKPKKAMKGTKMTFIGVKKATDRAALIKWMKAQ